MFCTSCGTAATEGSAFCTGCGKPVSATSSAAAPRGVSLSKEPSVPPPSFGGASAPPLQPAPMAAYDVPDGVKGWSWGAFLLNWIWAIGNRTWIGLLALIPYVGVIVAIWLGIKGREMAWKNGQWQSVEHFNRVQKKWSRWGVGLVIGSFLVGILAAIAIPAYQNYVRRAQDKAFEASLAEAQQQQEQQAQAVQAPPAPVAAAPVAPAAPSASDSGPIDSNADLPPTLQTVAGTLARATAADSNRFVTLNGNQLFNGEDANWQFPMRVFKLSQGREAILMASSGGRGNSCETLFFFLLTDGKSMRTTPEFGTCSAQGTFSQQGDVVTLVLPKMGGMSNYVLADGAVSEDGHAVVMDASNDPSK